MRNLKNHSLCVVMLVLLAAAPCVAVEYEAVDLGTLGGSTSCAYGINDSGQIVGYSTTASGEYHHACLWSDGVMTDLGTLGGSNSYARGINDSGQVVGDSRTDSGEDHAFLWLDGDMTDLGTLGGSSSHAYGINDSGQVVGYARTASEERHACMWIPATAETMLAREAQFITDQVDAGNIDVELEESLLAKVNAAIAALDRGNPNDAKVAMNELKALINELEAQTGKKITPEAAEEIIRLANEIIAALAG